MKAQRWSDQVHQRGAFCSWDSAEISVAWKVALLQVPGGCLASSLGPVFREQPKA